MGDATNEIIAAKDLLIRPVTPRFFVVGDAPRLEAIVHNYSQEQAAVLDEMRRLGFVDGKVKRSHAGRPRNMDSPDRGAQLGKIEAMLRGVGYASNDVAVLTNVSSDHLDLQGIHTLPELAEVKATIARITRPAGTVADSRPSIAKSAMVEAAIVDCRLIGVVGMCSV